MLVLSGKKAFCAFLLCLTVIAAHAYAQDISSKSGERLDSNIPRPIATGVLGQYDEAAVREIQAHLAAVGSAPWSGIQAQGQITYGPTDQTSYPATLSNMGFKDFRLDAQTGQGQMSIRIHGRIGETRGDNVPSYTIPPETAKLGLFPFELARLSNFSSKSTSLLDRGYIAIEGVQYHRISVEIAGIGTNSVTKTRRTIAVDLYFDSNHSLIKSAVYALAPAAHGASFLHVVTYGDFRPVGSSTIPFQFTETVDGERLWVLQLTEAQTAPQLDKTYFQF